MPSGESPSSRSSATVCRGSMASTTRPLRPSPRSPPCAVEPRVDPRLLQSCHRVLSDGRPFERFGACALGPEGKTFILGQGVEDGLGHRAAAGMGGAVENDLLHAFSPPWDY